MATDTDSTAAIRTCVESARAALPRQSNTDVDAAVFAFGQGLEELGERRTDAVADLMAGATW